MKLSGKTVLVTGASRGIGAAVARACARRGANLILIARSRQELDEVQRQCRGVGAEFCVVVSADLSDGEKTRQACAQILLNQGCPDLIVNNAGSGRFIDISETTVKDLHEMTALPYFAAFNVTQSFITSMRKRNSGIIVNLTSPASLVPFPHSTSYSVARWAMRGLTEALRSDLNKSKIKVLLAMPGKVASTYWTANPGSEERIPGISRILKTLSEDEAGEIIARGIEKEKLLIIRPLLLRWMYSLYLAFPNLISRIVRNF
ncbi:MAG: SDR family NAD(P)-dependent oxidoreductase [Oligoflexia bacterium]|nr:SDR family NAD(P)-dependent oxidoreductase [Oligoflexia bacterium]